MFNDEGSPAQISVDDPGTGDGFAAFCEGDIDIADASRPINEEEAALCADAGIEFVELEVAFDGITVLTNPANDAVECLTTGDLYALVGPESDGFASWSDGQEIATALGSSTELPDAPLDITAPGTESGTYDAFAELALGDPSEARLASGDITEDQVETLREDYSAQADDNAIIAGIEGSDSSFGFVGFAFAEGAGDAIAEIAVDAGDGCVSPSIETIADGSYPLSRSLYIYVSTASADENAGRRRVRRLLPRRRQPGCPGRGGGLRAPSRRPPDRHPGALGGPDHRRRRRLSLLPGGRGVFAPRSLPVHLRIP